MQQRAALFSKVENGFTASTGVEADAAKAHTDVYDKALNLMYYGTGNPSTWNPSQRPGDNKWSMSIWARDVDTGKVKWVYQMTPFDEWDFDGINEMILADINVKGKKTKALVHFDRNGFGYTLDRTNGALLVAKKFDPAVNWATHVDMKSGRPQVVSKYSTAQNGPDANTKGICPAALGSKDQQPAAFNPANGLFYVPTNHVCMDYEPFQVEYVAGQPYVGATLAMYPAPNPLSMFTTDTPAAHAFSIASNGARPLKLAP